jgi:hypothetical protein
MGMATKGKLGIIVPGVGDNECLMSNGGGYWGSGGCHFAIDVVFGAIFREF